MRLSPTREFETVGYRSFEDEDENENDDEDERKTAWPCKI